jgi:hypothetical protein
LWQLDQVMTAVELLEADQFADGERVMMKVEKAPIFEPAKYVPVAQADVGHLLERLERALAT